MADEQSVPSKLGHHAHIKALRGVRSAKQILYVVIAALHVGQHIFIKRVKARFGHFGVIFPPDTIGNRGCAHNVLVLGRAASELAGAYQKGATFTQSTLVILEGCLD